MMFVYEFFNDFNSQILIFTFDINFLVNVPIYLLGRYGFLCYKLIQKSTIISRVLIMVLSDFLKWTVVSRYTTARNQPYSVLKRDSPSPSKS